MCTNYISDNFPGNLALAPVSETLSASGMAGTASAPAIAQAAQWQSPQLVTEFETTAPATDEDKFEYMTLRAPVSMGTNTVFFRAMEGTLAVIKAGDLTIHEKILSPGPIEETTWRILYNTVHAVALERTPPEVPYSPWAGMRLLDIMPHLPVSLDYEPWFTLSKQTSTRSTVPPGRYASCTSSTCRTRS